MSKDRTHTLVVTEVDAEAGEWEMEIIHPPECPLVSHMDDLNGLPVVEYDCATGRQVLWAGWEDFPRADEIGAGTYQFRLWWSGPDWQGEYDGGVEFVDAATEPEGV